MPKDTVMNLKIEESSEFDELGFDALSDVSLWALTALSSALLK